MNLKKFAIRGLIVLAVVVALCMFFSQTIRTITTAKVKILSPKMGKMVQQVELLGKAVFPAAGPVKLEGAEDVQLTVLSVKVQPGSEVEKGDVIFTAEIADFDKTMDQLRASYNQVADQLSDLERKNRNLRLKRTDSDWAAAYAALTDARAEELGCRIELDALLSVEGLELENGALPKKAGDELKAAFDAHSTAKEALSAAQAAMDVADRYNIDEGVRTYIVDGKKFKDQMANYEDQMVKMNILRSKLTKITAPEDGYVVEINVKAGEALNGRTAAYTFSPKGEKPVLRVNTEETTLTIAKGTEVTFEGKKGKELESKVAETGLTISGEKYADVALTDKLIKDIGGSVALLSGDIPVNISYKARDNTTLLPASAVRGEGEERYVYVLREKQSAFGTNSLVTEKQTVTVLAEAGGMVSISEDLSWMKVAYMEDRAISEDTTVMAYVN